VKSRLIYNDRLSGRGSRKGLWRTWADGTNKLLNLIEMKKVSKMGKVDQQKVTAPTVVISPTNQKFKAKLHGNGFDPKEIGIDDHRSSYDHDEGDHGWESYGCGNPHDAG